MMPPRPPRTVPIDVARALQREALVAQQRADAAARQVEALRAEILRLREDRTSADALGAELGREREARQRAEAQARVALAERAEAALARVEASAAPAKTATTGTPPSPAPADDDRIVRLQADLANVRRHQAEAVEHAHQDGLRQGLLALADVADDVRRAQRGVDVPGVAEGLRQLGDRVLGHLERAGATVVGQAGEAFDPHRHEAIGTAPGERPGQVVQVEQIGLTVGERLLRPARVIVGAASTTTA